MEEKLSEIVEKYLEGNYLVGTEKKSKMIAEILLLFRSSANESSDFELQRLYEWLQDKNREPAQTKFTAGMTRNVAREFEFLIREES